MLTKKHIFLLTRIFAAFGIKAKDYFGDKYFWHPLVNNEGFQNLTAESDRKDESNPFLQLCKGAGSGNVVWNQYLVEISEREREGAHLRLWTPHHHHYLYCYRK